MNLTLTALLDTLNLLKRQQAVRDRGMLGTGCGRRAADGASRGGERGSRREAIEIGAHEPGIQRHEGRGTRLHDDGGLELGWLGRGDGGHVHGAAEGVCGGHLVHVHHGLRWKTVLGLLLGVLLLLLVVVRESLHLAIELLHVRRMAGVVGVLSLRSGIRVVVCKRRLGWSHSVCWFHGLGRTESVLGQSRSQDNYSRVIPRSVSRSPD